jgi:hypothetical protein
MESNDKSEQVEQTWTAEPNAPSQSQIRDQAGRWLSQLQDMIDQAGRQAGPVLRDVAAKAAELAAVAAENAGPVAHKAANVTEVVGDKLAARSKDLAADLRRAAEVARQNAVTEEAKPDDAPTS